MIFLLKTALLFISLFYCSIIFVFYRSICYPSFHYSTDHVITTHLKYKTFAAETGKNKVFFRVKIFFLSLKVYTQIKVNNHLKVALKFLFNVVLCESHSKHSGLAITWTSSVFSVLLILPAFKLCNYIKILKTPS